MVSKETRWLGRELKRQINSAAKFIQDLSLRAEDASLLFGDFLDDFYRASKEEKVQMLQLEPEAYDAVRDIDMVNIAATAHKLANDSGIPTPAWVFKDKYYAKEPYFPVRNSNLKLIYMFESPSEFKHRNMFVSVNALSRI